MNNKAHCEWQKRNLERIMLTLNIRTDADLIAALEGKAKATEIKRLLRVAIASEEAHNDD